MAVEEGDKFQFPDESKTAEQKEEQPEIEVSIEGEPEVVVVDDTSPKDRGRAPVMGFIDPTEEELALYSEKVSARIRNVDHARHDERRAKEAALREKDEATSFAQQVWNENQQLKARVHTGTKTLNLTTAQQELAAAEVEFKAAHEAYDTEALLVAQKKLNAAQLKIVVAENYSPSPVQNQNDGVQVRPTQQESPPPNPKAVRWQGRNQWFGLDTGVEAEMTTLALTVHKKLVEAGADTQSDEYFGKIDARVREKYPEYFGDARAARPPQRKSASVVAPTSRSSGAQRITMTQSQVALARKMGLTNLQYAQSVADLERQNGR